MQKLAATFAIETRIIIVISFTYTPGLCVRKRISMIKKKIIKIIIRINSV